MLSTCLLACLLHSADLRFWKVGSRKVYAVRQSEIGQTSGKGKGRRPSRASEIVIPSDSDSEKDFLPATKTRPCAVSASEIRTLTKEVGVIQEE